FIAASGVVVHRADELYSVVAPNNHGTYLLVNTGPLAFMHFIPIWWFSIEDEDLCNEVIDLYDGYVAWEHDVAILLENEEVEDNNDEDTEHGEEEDERDDIDESMKSV
ncbi:hypothetical protein L7F22_027644, partial [Adiantum nelumboides]|nr:hypothetical protein [Adiantum nelumboides]